MSVLLCANEDIDWLWGTTPSVTTTSTFFRGGYVRSALSLLYNLNITNKTMPFPGGAVTGCWVTGRVYCSRTSGTSNIEVLGLVNSASGVNGLWIVVTSSQQTALYTCSAAAGFVQVAIEAGTSSSYSTLHKYDMQVTNWGSSATVAVYVDGTQVISYTGNLSTGTGISNVNQVATTNYTGANTLQTYVSEVIVTDSATPTLAYTLNSLTPAALGATHAWTGTTVSNITGTSYSVANPFYTNSTSQQEDFTLGAIATGIYSIPAVQVSALMAASAGATPTTCALGWYNTNTTTQGVGSPQTINNGWQNYVQINATDPTNGGAAWSNTEFTSNYIQVSLQT